MRNVIYLKFLIVVFTFCSIMNLYAFSKPLVSEKDYQNLWCAYNKGITEFRLPDNSRIDCLTKDYAIEFDFANKWAESVGQAVYYAIMTGKKPGVVLIIKNKYKDAHNLDKLIKVANRIGIVVWVMYQDDLF